MSYNVFVVGYMYMRESRVKFMTESEKRLKRVCFTGHRPGKLQASEAAVKAALKAEIENAYLDGFRTFITGMAQGVDICAGELVIEFRESHDDVHLICALPFPGFDASWSFEWKERYQALLQAADLTCTISEEFSRAAYQIRNEWMVDHAARVIAVYNGDPKCGTKNTIVYAHMQGVPVVYAKGWN